MKTKRAKEGLPFTTEREGRVRRIRRRMGRGAGDGRGGGGQERRGRAGTHAGCQVDNDVSKICIGFPLWTSIKGF